MSEGLGLETRAGEESGQPTHSRPPTPSGPGRREEVVAPRDGAAETTPSREAEQSAARRSAADEEPASSRGPGPQRPEGPTLRQKRSAAASKARRERMKYDEVDQEVRDWLIYQQVKAESRSQRAVARIWGISEARVSQIMRDMRRKVANNPDLFAIDQRQEAQRQAEADFQLRSEQDLMFVTAKMHTAAKPLVTRKVGSRGEVTYEETITREQKSESLAWLRERRKIVTQIRDHASRPAAAPPPNSHLSPWHPWDCEAEEHASNWVQLVCQGILTRADYDVWCERHSHWCQLTYPVVQRHGHQDDRAVSASMLWGLTPEKAMRMGAKVPGLERFADLAKAWVRDGGKLRDDWETPPAKEDDISPLPTWTLADGRCEREGKLCGL
jgi:hypothetical protein